IDGHISVGYIDGAAQNDPRIGNLGIGLATNRILVRPALYGDLNLDGKTDAKDIGIMIGLGYYGSGNAPHGWLDGDLNGDGVVDGNDIGLIIGTGTYNNGSYGPSSNSQSIPKSSSKTTPTLSAAATDVARSTTLGAGKLTCIY